MVDDEALSRLSVIDEASFLDIFEVCDSAFRPVEPASAAEETSSTGFLDDCGISSSMDVSVRVLLT
jgi:hypothetical protein